MGLESAGFETVAFCEIEDFPRKVLAKHWPDVPIYNDVTELTGDRLKADGIAIDVITAGFPCQDISHAGKGAGIKDGTRSGLWSEVARLTGELRPQYVILENVAAILGRGADIVLGDLAEIGYDAEWHCIPASAVGAPHRRDRWWCVGYPSIQPSNGCEHEQESGRSMQEIRELRGTSLSHNLANPSSNGRQQRANGELEQAGAERASKREQGRLNSGPPAKEAENANPYGQRLERGIREQIAHAKRRQVEASRRPAECSFGWQRDGRGTWKVEPDVGRVANGIPKRVDRLKGLGNAVVPQMPAIIGQAIMELENQ